MKILVVNDRLLPQILTQFPEQYLISKVKTPVLKYRYLINDLTIEITVRNVLNDQCLRGHSYDLIYSTPDDFFYNSKHLMPMYIINPNLEVRLMLETDNVYSLLL